MGARRSPKRIAAYAAVVIAVNLAAFAAVGLAEENAVDAALDQEAADVQEHFEDVMDGYSHSFALFSQIAATQLANNPDPTAFEAFLKQLDSTLAAVEGDSFDGLYAYYQGQYLYSWDTPREVYEQSGYDATERPWYLDAVAAEGKPAFTPPYMSYANNYVLSTLSQLQPDGQTVFAYDLKMGDIQAIASTPERYHGGSVVLFDAQGTIVGSTDENLLGGIMGSSVDEARTVANEARAAAEGTFTSDEDRSKAQAKAQSAESFLAFWQQFQGPFQQLTADNAPAHSVATVDGVPGFTRLQQLSDGFQLLVSVPVGQFLVDTTGTWLVPLLVVEILLVYCLMMFSRTQKNRELKRAYSELGQTQKRLQIALEAAQKDAAVDDLTGIMNTRSFKRAVDKALDDVTPQHRGVFIMLDGDHFKQVNDTFGHDTGDDVIKLTAQMIVGRIRMDDVASRLHGDEFAIALSDTEDYHVANRLINDVNKTIGREAARRGLPPLTLSAGATVMSPGDTYEELSKRADAALYHAKSQGHDGQFATWEDTKATA